MFINCTIAENTSFDPVLSMQIIGGDARKLLLKNCIVYGNATQTISMAPLPEVRFCNIQGTCPGEGNIDINPNFVNNGYRVGFSFPFFGPYPSFDFVPGDFHDCSLHIFVPVLFLKIGQLDDFFIQNLHN